MQSRPRSNHRIDAILFLHLEVDKKGLAAGARSRNRRCYIRALGDMRAVDAMGPREFDKVRREDRRGRKAKDDLRQKRDRQ